MEITILNTFKSQSEAEAHRIKIVDSEAYGILSMYNASEKIQLFAPVKLDILEMFKKWNWKLN